MTRLRSTWLVIAGTLLIALLLFLIDLLLYAVFEGLGVIKT